MGVFDEKSEDYRRLPKEFKNMIGFLKNAKEYVDKATGTASENPAELKQQLQTSREVVKRQFALIERFVAPPQYFAYIVGLNNGQKPSATILYNGKFLEVEYPKELDLRPGLSVKISSKTMQIIELADTAGLGPVCPISKIISPEVCEVIHRGDNLAVHRGLFAEKNAGPTLELGDRVVLDQSANIIIANLGKENKQKLSNKPAVSWEDIVGQDNAKAALKEAVELPFKYPDKFKRHKKKQIKGIILLGPPGNGKSMLIEASATSVAKMHGDEALETGYMLINGPDVLEELVGRAEKNIRAAFEAGENHFEKHKYPAIIAIEEPDAVFIKRGTGKSSDVERSLVTTLLTQLNKTRSIVIMATNRPDILDPALVRAKRFNRSIYVGPPDQKAAAKVMAMNLEGAPLTGTAEELGEYAASEIFSDKRAIYEIKRKSTDLPYKFTYANLISYAEIADLAEKATSVSFRRDIEKNTDSATGKEEILTAINESFTEKLHLDHTDALRDAVKKIGEDFAGIKELTQSKN